MLNIGCHLSVGRGLVALANDAMSIDASTFQLFVSNPRSGVLRSRDDIEAFNRILFENNFAPIVVHAPYTINMASSDERVRNIARDIIKREILYANELYTNYYNIHPGCHVGQGIDRGIVLISSLLNEVMELCDGTTILLETMSGKGTEVGSKFEEIARIIEKVRDGNSLGVCLDTCHVFSAGYDIIGAFEEVLEDFDRILGLDRLKAIHLNDSMMPFDSHKDRHEQIGAGCIGFEAIVNVVSNSRLRGIPFILETPNDLSGWAQEIRAIRSLVKDRM